MKILVVDDSRAMRMLIMRAFRQSGYTQHDFVEASNGVEALDIIENNIPDLVLLDVNMSEMSGLAVAKEISQRFARLPFGFITTESDPDVLHACKEYGALFVLEKPFDSDQLKGAVRKVIGSP